MKEINLKKLRDNPILCEKSSNWFSQKWDIPVEAYKESIEECIGQKTQIPQWYVVVNDNGEIIAGAGVIENDFHSRKDLSPNLCALFVEEGYRNQGIAKYILDFVRKDLGDMGFNKLYLVTDYKGLYEKYGWDFITMANDDEDRPIRVYSADCL